MMSSTPRPRSDSVDLPPGNGSPWSVVRITSVSSASSCSSSALSTAPTPWSSERALCLNEAMSRRVIGESGRFGGRNRVERVAHGGRLEVVAVGLEEPDREEERLARPLAQQLHGRGRDVLRLAGVGVGDVVVAEVLGVGRDVLLADHRRPVAGVAQRVQEVLARVLEREAAVREPEHAVGVRPASGQQRGAAGRAGRRRRVGLAEQQPLVGEPLDVGRRDLMAVRLDVSSGVVGVDEDDVRARCSHT